MTEYKESWPEMDELMGELTSDEIVKRAKEAKKRSSVIDGLPALTDQVTDEVLDQASRIMSGFEKLDSIVGGFRKGNSYLIAGLEKSGKSAFLMNIVQNILNQEKKVGYINTELQNNEFFDRMAGIKQDKPYQEIELDSDNRKGWVLEHEGQFYFAGISKMEHLCNPESEQLEFAVALRRINQFINAGCEVIVVDNLTTYQNLTDGGQQKGWEVLAGCIQQLVKITKEKNVVVFMVIHTKQDVVYGETPSGVRSIVKDDPTKIFSESITVTRRPSLSDVYGGGGAKSQISGCLLVWRPYQKFDMPEYQQMSHIILDSFRHAPSGREVSMKFTGEKFKFEEAIFEPVKEYTQDVEPY